MRASRHRLTGQLFFTMRLAILALGMSALLCLPAITMTVHAFGHNVYYNCWANLAEEAAEKKQQLAEKESVNITVRERGDADKKQERLYDYEETASLKKK